MAYQDGRPAANDQRVTPVSADEWWSRRTGKSAEEVEIDGTFYLPANENGPYRGPPRIKKEPRVFPWLWLVMVVLGLLLAYLKTTR
jgi:hypothetical protein